MMNKEITDKKEMNTDERLAARIDRLSMLIRRVRTGAVPKRALSQERVLKLLNASGSLTISDIAFLTGIRPQSAGEIVAKLEEKGLLVKSPDENDKRSATVSLTQEGSDAAAEIEQENGIKGSLFTSLSEEEKQQLISLSDKAINGFASIEDGFVPGDTEGENFMHRMRDFKPGDSRRIRQELREGRRKCEGDCDGRRHRPGRNMGPTRDGRLIVHNVSRKDRNK
ncbi:MAG: MarR family transcriptional regulator [Eubacteriaceae bacterium]|nr:MarR family transcriptional regulator [Eubacteriaceae bacterium]